MAITNGHGNPDWIRDEIILALDLYFSCGETIPSEEDSRVVELSELLRRLPYHSGASRVASFRNPAGVTFKLQNLRQVAAGKGLNHTSKVDRDVWSDFGSQPERVFQLAKLIRELAAHDEAFCVSDGTDTDVEFSEGRLVTRIHESRERDRRVRKQLLSLRRKRGALQCDMCETSSPVVDTSMEDSIFEAHHRILLSVGAERKTRLSDMALLCANCHRLLHRAISSAKRWIDVDDGRDLLRKQFD